MCHKCHHGWPPPPLPSSAPCGGHRYVGDNINIWESVTNGIGHWQGIWPEARNTWNVWPRQIRKLRVFWRVTLEHIGATSNCLCHELCFHDPIMTSRDPLVATLKSTRGTRYGWNSTIEGNEKQFLVMREMIIWRSRGSFQRKEEQSWIGSTVNTQSSF